VHLLSSLHCKRKNYSEVDGVFQRHENSEGGNCGKPNISVLPLLQGDKVVPAEETRRVELMIPNKKFWCPPTCA